MLNEEERLDVELFLLLELELAGLDDRLDDLDVEADDEEADRAAFSRAGVRSDGAALDELGTAAAAAVRFAICRSMVWCRFELCRIQKTSNPSLVPAFSGRLSLRPTSDHDFHDIDNAGSQAAEARNTLLGPLYGDVRVSKASWQTSHIGPSSACDLRIRYRGTIQSVQYSSS